MRSDPGTSDPLIAVAGPPDGGVSSVASALADRMPDHRVIEWTAPHRGETPDAVVFVLSAAAPMTPSQTALLDTVLKDADRVPVIVAVSKIDLHRDWAGVLDANRRLWSAARPATAWVGVTADPDIGGPRMEHLVDAVRHCRIRCAPETIAAIRPIDRRAELIARRGELAQARLRLSAAIRSGCAELRTELHRQAARLNRRGLQDFTDHALARIGVAVVEWDQAMAAEFDAILRGSGIDVSGMPAEPVPVIAAGPLQAADPTELRLTVTIGVVFGTGAALTASRLLTGVAQGWAPATGTVLGLGLALWVIGSRRLLSERAATARWTADVVASARQTLEERAASQALAVEVAIGLAAADRR